LLVFAVLLSKPVLGSENLKVSELTSRLTEISHLLAENKRAESSFDVASRILSRALDDCRNLGTALATNGRTAMDIRARLRHTETRIRVLGILIGNSPHPGDTANRFALTRELDRIEKTGIAKLEQKMFDDEREGRDTVDAEELINEARKTAGELRALPGPGSSTSPQPAWLRLGGKLQLLTKAAKESLNGAQLKPGVTQKQLRQQQREIDERTGCEPYRNDFDLYAVCKKRGLPTRRSSHGGFAYRPVDQEIAGANLPQECRDASGQAKWDGAPEVIEWVYCDNVNSGCEYYLFVQRFTALDDLRLKDTLTAADKIQAFVQACRQETFGGAHQLAYVGTYPLSSHEFLDVLFGTQSAPRPKDTFGFDGMRRQGLALAPPPPFKLESFLFDTSLQAIVRKLNALIREVESFRNSLTAESSELAKLEQAPALTPAELDRRKELEEKPDVVFVKAFNEEHAKGVIRDHKPSNVAAVDALKKAIAVYPPGDPQRERFRDLQIRLQNAQREFDAGVEAAVKSLSRGQSEELVYHPGDSLFLFFKGTGSTAPRLRMTLTIKQLAVPPGASSSTEDPFGIVTRTFDDPPETNRQQNVVFAKDYQQYWVSFFTQPLRLIDAASAPRTVRGVVQNSAMVTEVPAQYTAVVELFDETTKSRARKELRFSVIPNRAPGSGLSAAEQTGRPEPVPAMRTQ
jgi:hypothetical protein